MGPPTPAAQKITTRPVISAPEIAKEAIEKRVPIPSGNGPVILEQRTLPEYCRLNINCAVPLAENVIRIFRRIFLLIKLLKVILIKPLTLC